MRNLILGSLFILSFFVSASAQKAAGGSAKPDPAKDVRAAFDRLNEGIRQVDAAKVMDVYHNDPRTLFFNNNGSVTLGWEQMRENRESLYERTKNVTLEVTGVRIEMLGSRSAYVSYKWSQTQEFDGQLEKPPAARRLYSD